MTYKQINSHSYLSIRIKGCIDSVYKFSVIRALLVSKMNVAWNHFIFVSVTLIFKLILLLLFVVVAAIEVRL